MSTLCGLKQIITQPTRVCTSVLGTSSTCIDHIYSNVSDQCSKAVSVSIGCSDHTIIGVTRKTKLPKGGRRVIHRRSYKYFNQEHYINDIQATDWSEVCADDNPDSALYRFMEILMNIIDKHVPVSKSTVRQRCAPWLDDDLKELMQIRDNAKKKSVTSGNLVDKENYKILRNNVVKMNKKKKRDYFQNEINEAKNDSKKLWSTLNKIMGRSSATVTPYVENNGLFISSPQAIANYFMNYFTSKVEKLRATMAPTNPDLYDLILNKIMNDKNCSFAFHKVDTTFVENILKSLADGKASGIDHLDSRLFRLAAVHLSLPICHLFNQSFAHSIFPDKWKESKMIPLSKNKKLTFTGPNCRPISVLPLMSKIMEKIAYQQMQKYFTTNELITKYQHALERDIPPVLL